MSGNKKEMYNCKISTYKKLKSDVASYPSKKKYLTELTCRRNAVHALRVDAEMQTEILRTAESSLTAQIAELSMKLENERSTVNGYAE